MISYVLQCRDNHRFESWFRSASAFEALAQGGQLVCPVCGSAQVAKSLMAPAVHAARAHPALTPALPARVDKAGPSTGQANGSVEGAATEAERETALAALRREVEATSNYVGLNFVTEARAMHDGEIPKRPIHGEARVDEARLLIEDGVPVAPLPFLPRRKVN